MPAPSGPVPSGAAEWRSVDAGAGGAPDLARLEQIARDHPWSRNVRLALVNGYLDAGRNADALAEILRLTEAGYVFSATGKRAILELFAGADRDALQHVFRSDPPGIETSTVLATVPADVLLVEAAAVDRATGRIFAGSIVSRGLFVREQGDGAWSRVALDGAGSIGGMVIDEERRMLWVASGVYEETPEPESAFSGLIGLPLDGGPERRIAGPAGSTASDVMLAEDGTLYAADPIRGAIYRAAPSSSELVVFVAPGTFRSPQGMVEVPGGLLVSDWGYGLALVDPVSGRARRVDPDAAVLLDGIDGMWRRGAEIVAIQNGARPAQIVTFRLTRQGTRVTDWRVIERGGPGGTEPSSGSLSGSRLVYVGNGQWDRFARGGTAREGKAPQATEIRLLDLAKNPAAARKNPG